MNTKKRAATKAVEVLRTAIHENERSHDSAIIQIGDKKVKMVYQAYNASEKFTASVFSGSQNQLNLLFDMMDLGVKPERRAYIFFTEEERKKRANLLIALAEEACTALF